MDQLARTVLGLLLLAAVACVVPLGRWRRPVAVAVAEALVPAADR